MNAGDLEAAIAEQRRDCEAQGHPWQVTDAAALAKIAEIIRPALTVELKARRSRRRSTHSNAVQSDPLSEAITSGRLPAKPSAETLARIAAIVRSVVGPPL